MRSFLNKAFSVFLSNWMKQVAAFALGVIIARVFGAEGKGLYFLVTTLTSLFGVSLSLGINNSIVYHLKHNLISFRKGFTVVLVNSLIVAVICFVLLVAFQDLFWNVFFSPAEFDSFYIIFTCLYIPIVLTTLFLVTYLLAQQNSRLHRLIFVGPTILTLIITGVMTAIWEIHLKVALNVLLSVELLASSLVSILLLRQNNSVNLNSTGIKELYIYGVKGYAGSIGNTVLTQVDALIIAAFLSPAALGVYSVSKSLYRALLSVPQALNGMLFGKFCEMSVEDSMAFGSKIIKGTMLVMATGVVIGFIVSEKFIIGVFGEEFVLAAEPFYILLIAAFFMGSSSSINPLLMAQGFPWICSKIAITSGVISVFSTFVLVPKAGVNGAAMGCLAGTICFFLLRFYYRKRVFAPKLETNIK